MANDDRFDWARVAGHYSNQSYPHEYVAFRRAVTCMIERLAHLLNNRDSWDDRMLHDWFRAMMRDQMPRNKHNAPEVLNSDPGFQEAYEFVEAEANGQKYSLVYAPQPDITPCEMHRCRKVLNGMIRGSVFMYLAHYNLMRHWREPLCAVVASHTVIEGVALANIVWCQIDEGA